MQIIYITEICSRKPIKDLCYFKKITSFYTYVGLWGRHYSDEVKWLHSVSYCCYIYQNTFRNRQLYKILIWWPQLLKELTGGGGYKYRFKPNIVPSISLHKETKCPGYGKKSALRNSSSGRASWLASACFHPSRWHLAFLVSAVCKLCQ